MNEIVIVPCIMSNGSPGFKLQQNDVDVYLNNGTDTDLAEFYTEYAARMYIRKIEDGNNRHQE